MKAITLWQPWASLIAIGAKKIETRSWPTKYRGPLAIHAAKSAPLYARALADIDKAFNQPLTGKKEWDPNIWLKLPFGAVLCTCNLVDCLEIGVEYMSKWGSEIEHPLPTGNELAFGDYTPGRFAWILGDIKPLPEPIPTRGAQGLWNWEPPEVAADEA